RTPGTAPTPASRHPWGRPVARAATTTPVRPAAVRGVRAVRRDRRDARECRCGPPPCAGSGRCAVTVAVLSLGSNLGDRITHLRAAVAGFADVLVAASPVYETAPWGGVAQEDFLNAVLLVADPDADAWEWLRR